ncbi:MAG: hypothetical protein IJ906_01100, partial [Oscillospiraceae bacterium]|nr:hypothetical protein [Oscillospiraceae bacterium]
GNWCIPGYRLSSENDAQITFVTADVSLLNNCGLIGGARFRSDKPHFVFLKSMALNGDYTVSKTSFDENGWKDTEVADDIKEFHNAFGESLNFSDVNFLTPDLNSGYYLKAENEQPLDVSMQYDGILIMADGTAQAVHFSPEGTCRVDSTGQPYHLEYVLNEDYPGTMYYHEFSGNAAQIQITVTPEGYVLESDRLQDVTVHAIGNGNNGKLTFSADTEKALVYETAEHTLAVAVDADGNGSFETTIAESYTLGDVNRDGSINAKDASEVLIASAKAGTGQHLGLTDVQQKAADVDRDGNINAVDASWILLYAAAIGTGTAESTMEEYVKH